MPILVFCFILFSCATVPVVKEIPGAEEPETAEVSSGEFSVVPEKKPPVKVTGITPDPGYIRNLKQEALLVLSGYPLPREDEADSFQIMTFPTWLDSRLGALAGSRGGYGYLDREGNILEPGSSSPRDLSPRFWGELTLTVSGGMGERFSGYLVFPPGWKPEVLAAGLFDAGDGSWQNYETEDIQGKFVFITPPPGDFAWPVLAAAQAALWGARAAVIQGGHIFGVPALPILHLDPLSAKKLKEHLSRGPADVYLNPVPVRDTGPELPAAALMARIAGGGTAPDLLVVGEPGNSLEELAGVLSWELGLFKAMKESREEPPGDVVFVFPLTPVPGLWASVYQAFLQGRGERGIRILLLTTPGGKNLYPGMPRLVPGDTPVLLDDYINDNYPGFSFTRFFFSFFGPASEDFPGQTAGFLALESKTRETAAALDRLFASGALNPADSSRLEALCAGFFQKVKRENVLFRAGGTIPRFLHQEYREALRVLDLALEKARLKDSAGAEEALLLLENLGYARYFTSSAREAAGMGSLSDLGDLMLSFTLFPRDGGDAEGREAELLYWRGRTMRELNRTLEEEALLLEKFLETAEGIISRAESPRS